MSTINVLIVVDALGAATSGLSSNVYLVDTNKHMGSSSEGQEELYTACTSTNQGGDTIIWAVAPIDPGSDVSISSFTGSMISERALIPSANSNGSWSGALVPNLSAGSIQYSVVLNIDGEDMTFDPFLKVTT
jgi:hypothetical protein